MFDLTLSIIILSVIIFCVTWGIRKGSEIILPSSLQEKSKIAKLWREVFLPLLPLLLGNIFGLIKSYPYPAEFNSIQDHMLFGAFCGAICGIVYRVVWSGLKLKLAPADQADADKDKLGS